MQAMLWGLILESLILTAWTTLPTDPTAGPAATPAAIAGAETLILVNGTLIDGTGAEPMPDAVLILSKGKITAVGRRAQVQIPVGERVIDVRGATILPGFINAHVHDAYSASNLEVWAQAGVTTVRDEGLLSGHSSLPELIARRDNDWIKPRYARLVSAGRMMSPPHGYGRLFISSPSEAYRKTGQELDRGADLIKVAMEDGYGSRSDLPVLSVEDMRAVVSAAHERGTVVSGHITEAKFLTTVVEAGVDDIAHMAWDFIPDELMSRVIAKQILVVPTLTVMEAYGTLAGSQANLRRFVAMGGQVALGNDYTDVPQNNFDQFELGMPMHEIHRMAEAGMSPMQTVVAATRNAARVCNLEEDLGTLEVDKVADVLVVHGDPLTDLNSLQNVRLVIHYGVIIRDQKTPLSGGSAQKDLDPLEGLLVSGSRPARQ